MPSATYRVEVAWSTQLTGVINFDRSTLGGTDVLAGGFGSDVFDDITSHTAAVSVARGRSGDMGQMMAGTCSIETVDLDGDYSPENAGGTVYPNVRPMRPVRVVATYSGTEYVRFYGYIQSISSSPSMDSRRTVIQAADFNCWLQIFTPVLTSQGATTTGAAIDRILDGCGFSGDSFRNLDVGDPIPDFSADGTKTAKALIDELLDAERGVFYIAATGVATYEDRHAYARAPRDVDQADVATVMLDAGVSIDTDVAIVYNDARVTRTGGTVQTATDATSKYLYGYRSISVNTSYLTDDTEALELAQHLVRSYKDPRSIFSFGLTNNSATALGILLGRDLQDRIAASETRFGTTGSWYIEGIREDVSVGALHRAAWTLRKHPTWTPIVLDTSELGSTDVLIY